MRFFRGELFFQNLQNQDMSTTEGFASVRESVTSRDAEVTAQRLDFQYVVFEFFKIYDHRNDATKRRQRKNVSFDTQYRRTSSNRRKRKLVVVVMWWCL